MALFEASCNDLRKGLKGIVKARCSRGFARHTICTDAWATTTPYLLGNVCNQFCDSPSVTASTMTMMLNYRYGQFWNLKIAYRLHRSYSPSLETPTSDRWPYCEQHASGKRIFAGCETSASKATYSSCHDLAFRTVLKAIAKGTY